MNQIMPETTRLTSAQKNTLIGWLKEKEKETPIIPISVKELADEASVEFDFKVSPQNMYPVVKKAGVETVSTLKIKRNKITGGLSDDLFKSKSSKKEKPRYEDYEAMIIKALGYELAQEENSVLLFMKSLETWNPEIGTFSTWFWQNLRYFKLGHHNSKRNDAPLDEALEVCTPLCPCKIIEFRDSLSTLSADALTIVKCLYETCSPGKKSKRTKWAHEHTASRTEIRKELKQHCKYTLEWTWPRYWDAVHEIEDFLKEY